MSFSHLITFESFEQLLINANIHEHDASFSVACHKGMIYSWKQETHINIAPFFICSKFVNHSVTYVKRNLKKKINPAHSNCFFYIIQTQGVQLNCAMAMQFWLPLETAKSQQLWHLSSLCSSKFILSTILALRFLLLKFFISVFDLPVVSYCHHIPLRMLKKIYAPLISTWHLQKKA